VGAKIKIIQKLCEINKTLQFVGDVVPVVVQQGSVDPKAST
jgi:hypothetical protein